jgi:hypothetical protein
LLRKPIFPAQPFLFRAACLTCIKLPVGTPAVMPMFG